MKVAVIGGGAAGLSAAYHLSREKIAVTVFEAESILGGLASWFEIGGNYLERYYHFLCLNDHEYLATVRELELEDAVRWRGVRMGYFYDGKRFNFGHPWDLLLFPHLSVREKLKFARAITEIKRAPFHAWKRVAEKRVVPWLIETFGENVFRIIHAPLISGKFGEYKENLSAAWMWARIHRIGKSRTRVLNREIYGYLEGGSFRLMEALAARIRKQNGALRLQAPISEVRLKDGRVEGIVSRGKFEAFDAIVSTIPFQLLRRMVAIDNAYFRQPDTADYYGVTCLVLRLRRALTPHFWLNINDRRIEIPGVIEYTNLNPLPFLNGDHLLYIPQYLDPSDERFALTREDLLQKYLPYLKLIRPDFREDDVVEAYAFKNTHAQPLCDMGFHERIPSKRTPIRGLYVTDSYQLHPDDRTVSSSLKMGHEAADLLREDFR